MIFLEYLQCKGAGRLLFPCFVSLVKKIWKVKLNFTDFSEYFQWKAERFRFSIPPIPPKERKMEMVLEFVFNPKYEMATGHYVKIGGLITADDGKTHVFAVIKNLSSGALERQKYADCGSWKANKVMSGMDRSSLYKGACKAEDKPTFLPLAYHLKIAFSRLNDAVGFSEADKEAVLLAIEALIRDLKIEGETPAPEVKVVSESEFSDVPSEALEDDEFVKKVTFAIGGEVGKIVSVDGVKFRLHTLEEGMAPTPVFLPGESPWAEEPGGLQFMGSQRVRHN